MKKLAGIIYKLNSGYDQRSNYKRKNIQKYFLGKGIKSFCCNKHINVFAYNGHAYNYSCRAGHGTEHHSKEIKPVFIFHCAIKCKAHSDKEYRFGIGYKKNHNTGQ